MAKKSNNKKRKSSRAVARSERELLDLLEVNLGLLDDYHARLMSRDYRYIGEAAGKVRLLTYPTGQRPLLTALQKKTGFADDAIHLETYMNGFSAAIKLSSGAVYQTSRMQLIADLANKTGSAHVSPTIPEHLKGLLQSTFRLQGHWPIVLELSSIATSVIRAGDAYLNNMEKKGAFKRTDWTPLKYVDETYSEKKLIQAPT